MPLPEPVQHPPLLESGGVFGEGLFDPPFGGTERIPCMSDLLAELIEHQTHVLQLADGTGSTAERGEAGMAFGLHVFERLTGETGGLRPLARIGQSAGGFLLGALPQIQDTLKTKSKHSLPLWLRGGAHLRGKRKKLRPRAIDRGTFFRRLL